MYQITDKKIKYMLNLAELVSTESPDQSTKCGCILTDNDLRVVSTGYNGFAKNTDNNIWPQTRPDKYLYVIHAEENSIINCSVILRHINGGYAFVNRISCQLCLIKLHNFGVHTVYQKNNSFNSINKEAIDKVIKETGIKSILVD